MNRRLAAVIAIVPLVVIVVAARLAHVQRPVSVEQSIARYLKQSNIDLRASDNLGAMAVPFVDGSRFAGKINTRSAPIPGYLNLYVIAADPDHEFGFLRCNCAYIGHSIVLCDKRFLETFTTALRYAQPDQPQVLEQVNRAFSTFLTNWLVGHEIGHATLHDLDGRFVMSSRPVWPWQSNTVVWKQRENEADNFVIDHLSQDSAQRANFTLTNIMFQTYHRAYVEQHQDSPFSRSPSLWQRIEHLLNSQSTVQSPPTNSGSVVYIRDSWDGIHDPWVFRAFRMSGALNDRVPAVAGDPGFLQGLSANFALSTNGYDPGTFCDGVALREP